ncbi:MAG: Asp-tRNA(Asn)/Glu-tRNA(Gln) amidotransferase subunit GatC, partial [Candidatus Colwellbacteria bacterium]|nr:Asp-tRNA(Asn)/Glu-tRNA(Gln) amidotransferase subunit GatC [Candidatus Colwellbacteria bacterium]
MPDKEFDIKYFSGLSRVELTPEEEDKFTKDLNEILDYFKELQEINTDNIPPITGGTSLVNIMSEDGPGVEEDPGVLKAQFPDDKKGFLQVPKVFE